MIIGISGSGKTNLSEELFKELNATTLIHGDKIMVDVLLAHKRFFKFYMAKVSLIFYSNKFKC